MPRFLRRAACLSILLALAATPALAQRSGAYRVAGTNLDGTSYEGVVLLQQVGIVSFTLLWRVGGTEIRGVGMVSGHNFAVTYGSTERPGLGIYELQPDGTMVGSWTLVGANQIGTETLTPPPEAPPAPAAARPPAPRP